MFFNPDCPDGDSAGRASRCRPKDTEGPNTVLQPDLGFCPWRAALVSPSGACTVKGNPSRADARGFMPEANLGGPITGAAGPAVWGCLGQIDRGPWVR